MYYFRYEQGSEGREFARRGRAYFFRKKGKPGEGEGSASMFGVGNWKSEGRGETLCQEGGKGKRENIFVRGHLRTREKKDVEDFLLYEVARREKGDV